MLWNLRIAVIDDEPLQVDIIKSSISGILASKKVTCTIDSFLRAKSLLESTKDINYDAYFIDINLASYDGIELAKSLKEHNPNTLIVFISNQEERVYDSLEVQPIAFVRKSHFLHEIEPAINKVVKILCERFGDSYILVKVQGGLVKIDISSCTYIECSGKKQILHQIKTKTVIEIHSSMELLENELQNRGFIRTHKGYLVNYRYISYIANLSVTLTTNEVVPVSRDKNTEVKERFIELTKENSIIF